MTQVKFPVKGQVPDNEYDKLLSEVKDQREKLIKIGDIVAYATCSRYACPVDCGKIIEIELEFEPEWVKGTMEKTSWGGMKEVGGYHRANYNKIMPILKIKPEQGRTLTRKTTYVAKVEQ